MRRDQTAGSKFWSIANVLAVAAIAIISCVNLESWIGPVLSPASYGDFGVSLDNWGWRVAQVGPGSPAEKAGLRKDDVIEQPHALRESYLIAGLAQPRVGESATFLFQRGGKLHSLALVAAPPQRLSLPDLIAQTAIWISSLVFLLVAAFLAVVRPNKMTWGFYLCAGAVVWSFVQASANIPTNWLLLYSLFCFALLTPAGIIGFLVFSLRFPNNAPAGWRKKIDDLTPLILVVVALLQPYCFGLPNFPSAGDTHLLVWLQHVWDFNVLLIVIVSLASLVGAYRSSAGLEREKIRWVVFGFACACVGVMLAVLSNEGMFPIEQWVLVSAESLTIALPVTVAYAIIRHRVIAVRFVVSRALIFGVIIMAMTIAIATLDKILSTKFANSPSQTAIYAGMALLVGFMLNAGRQRIAAVVDSLFFHQWHRTQEQANTLGDLIYRASLRSNLYEPLTAGVGEAFSLSSAALFERVTDGGFVRVAARGWPPRTLWHLLPGDPLARRAQSLRPVDIDSLGWAVEVLPAGVARPVLMVPIVAGKQIPALLLLGAHENGTGLDPDELRALRRLCADAGAVYSRQPITEPNRPSFSSEPLGV
jgi:hypothetical protein